ncbi:heterokaryon incompatibility protein-domain-containing protein [Dichotomopilus funicola]|uniref:Heterokaryon incompatibility protein-domain-containing protein n=1 Tax=Dichotomopilus funicola TaxID=1934379 RepID=A0AAN6ZQL9_9PEZI|nr:heterokaryon incompatibility protein-domain-containing protein [Dichotomopilus funicola]
MPIFKKWKSQLHRKSKPPPNNSSHYIYSTTPLLAPNTTRMISLLPHLDSTTPITCSVFTYDLSAPTTGETHIYSALSYVWGTGQRSHSITLNNYAFPVTENLHSALWHLRDRQLERVLWVDAICINQEDNKEKEKQIPLMRTIYAQAGRVMVWLGAPLENECGDEALRKLRTLAQIKANDPGVGPTVQELAQEYRGGCETVLKRDWFRRMWILQEVGVARSVVVMCGSVQIDGQAFCEGVAELGLEVDLQTVVNPVVQLIRDALYRPKYEPGSRGVFSMGELLDMYRSCRATLQHDKIYALLGLSAEGLDAPALQPEYTVPWHEVFRRATVHTFGSLCTVQTWPDRHTAVITGKCLFLGLVTRVDRENHADGQVHIWVNCTVVGESLGYGERGWNWAFRPFSESVQEGDVICHLQGAAKPSIVRLCQDHFTTIKTTAPSVPSGRPSDALEQHFCHIALTFTIPPGTSTSWAGLEESTELLDVAPEYQEEPEKKQKRLDGISALLEDRFVHSFQYSGSKSVDSRRLVEQCGPEILISEQVVRAVAGCLSEEKPVEVMQFLFQKRGDKLPITNEVVQAAAANYQFGYRVLQLLFEKRGERLPVSEQVVAAAAGNQEKAYDIVKLLFEQRGRELVISEEVAVAAADNYWHGHRLMRFLFEQRGENLPVTERVVKTAAANTRCGYETMKVLFQHRESLHVSEEVLVEAARNPRHGYDIMRLLFERDEDLAVSENVLKAAAGNQVNGYEVMLLLFEKRGKDLTISEEVIKAAQDNSLYAGEFMQLFEAQGLLKGSV